MGAVRTRNEQRPIPAGLRSSRVQSHKADSVFLLAFFSWVDPAVQSLLHHSKVEPTLTRSCSCPCGGDTSPALRGVCSCCCCYCCCCRRSPLTPIANNLVKSTLCVLSSHLIVLTDCARFSFQSKAIQFSFFPIDGPDFRFVKAMYFIHSVY